MSIREIRKGLGLTQAELGRAIGVKGITVHNWEDGTTRILAIYLKKICRMAGVSMDDVELKGENE